MTEPGPPPLALAAEAMARRLQELEDCATSRLTMVEECEAVLRPYFMATAARLEEAEALLGDASGKIEDMRSDDDAEAVVLVVNIEHFLARRGAPPASTQPKESP